MLQKVQSFWVEGVLESALQGQAALDLNLVDIPNAVPKAWTSVDDLLTNTPQPLPSGTPIDELFDQHDGALPIFGGPGGGKTTLLLQLARDLLARAEWNPGYPMPIVFNLSSWGKQNRPLADWLVEELNAKYDVPQKLGRAWVADDQIIALLDRLDEVDAAQRAACVDAINAFRKEHGFMRMAVCCRQAEYERLPRQLRLGGAVLVQPLTPEQVDAYLARGGEPLIGLRAAVHVDPAMGELAQTPLMLGIMIGAYRGQPARALLAQGARGGQQKRLFAAYVDRMFARRGAASRYSRAQTERWLAWLARGMQRKGQSVFLIEGLQPDWLSTARQRVMYTLLDRGGWGLLAGLIVWMSYKLFGRSLFVDLALLLGALIGLITALFGGETVNHVRALPLSQRIKRNMIPGFFVVVLGVGIVMAAWRLLDPRFRDESITSRLIGSLLYGAMGGLAGGAAGGVAGEPGLRPRNICVVERLRWSWKRALRTGLVGLASGLLIGLGRALVIIAAPNLTDMRPQQGLAIGLGIGLIFGIFGALFGGLTTSEVAAATRPNEGIRNSVRNAVLIGIAAGLCTCLAAVVFDAYYFFLLLLGLSATFIGLLTFGGYAYLSHLALRFVLWRSGAIPWNYAAFLDYAASRVFLRKVGGGYIFVHRMLLEYFAALPDAQAQSISAAQAPQRATEGTAIK